MFLFFNCSTKIAYYLQRVNQIDPRMQKRNVKLSPSKNVLASMSFDWNLSLDLQGN